MIVKKLTGGATERTITTAMIVDEVVLSKLAARWTKDSFSSPWANLVGGWAVSFFNEYGKPPRKAIQSIFESWKVDNPDDADGNILERLLSALSGEYANLKKEINSQYILDLAGKHLNKVKMTKVKEQLEGFLETNQLDKAEGLFSEWSKIEIGGGGWINPFSDESAVKSAFASKGQPLVVYNEALRSFYGDSLERDAFVAFQAPEKRGKSWMLIDLAWRAMLQGRKVAYFEVGDLSQDQLMRRLMVRATKRPFKALDSDGQPKKVRIPTFLTIPSDEQHAMPDFEEKSWADDLDYATAWAACKKVVTKPGRESLFRLSVHPNSSISILGIKAILQGWEREGYRPDVVICDYADILAPISGFKESRDQINATWKQMRALSQSLHCLVVTATQADADSNNVETQGRSNFSEDKRKFAHTTGIVGINQTDLEKDRQVMRLNWLVLRESEFSITKCCHVAGCLAIASPTLKSIF